MQLPRHLLVFVGVAVVLALVFPHTSAQCPANTTVGDVSGGSLTGACVQTFSASTITIDSPTVTTISGAFVIAATTTLEAKTALTMGDVTVRGVLRNPGTAAVSATSLDFAVGSILELTIGSSFTPMVLNDGNITAAGSLAVSVPAGFVFDVGTRVPVFTGVSNLNSAFTINLVASARSSSSAVVSSRAGSGGSQACAHAFGRADADGDGSLGPSEFDEWVASPMFVTCAAMRGASSASRRSVLAGSATSATLECDATTKQCDLVGSLLVQLTCPPCKNTVDNAGLAAGATVGGFIGAAILVVIIIAICMFMRKRRRKRAARLAAEDKAAAVRAKQEAEAEAKREAKREAKAADPDAAAANAGQNPADPAAAADPAAPAPADAPKAEPVIGADAPSLVSESYSGSSSSYSPSRSYFSSYSS